MNAPPGLSTPRLWTVLALLAALPQLAVYGRGVLTGTLPGSAYQPRVDAYLLVSQTAAAGGPFATVREGGGFSTAPVLLSDLGMAAVADAFGRVTGRGLTSRELGLINLAVLASGLCLLIAAWPARLRPALVPALLLVPLSIREYRSLDVVAIHGAFATIATALAVLFARPWPAWSGIPLGMGLFALHKARSVYGLYALGAILIIALLVAFLDRNRRSMLRLAAVVVAFAALEVPWRALTAARADDSRVADSDSMTSHALYEPLLSGLGWSENRWKTKPGDPWVATWIGERLGKPIAKIATLEGEADAREVYVSLWREAPGHMVSIYAARVPRGIQELFFVGWAGFLPWLVSASIALSRAWRGRDPMSLSVLLAPILVGAGLMTQIVMIDPRLLYGYPLRFVSALSLFTAAGLLMWPPGSAPAAAAPGPEPPSPA
jgi:hypothetical protein